MIQGELLESGLVARRWYRRGGRDSFASLLETRD